MSSHSEANLEAFDKAILKALAREVLRNFQTLKKICLMLNRQDTVANWKDVAGGLGFTNEQIFGHFALKSDPAEAVLREWMMERRGEIGTLIVVFQENQLLACLEELQRAIDEYKEHINKKKNKESDLTNEDKSGKENQDKENKITGDTEESKYVKHDEKKLAEEVNTSCKKMQVEVPLNSNASRLEIERKLCACAKDGKLSYKSDYRNSVTSSSRQGTQPKYNLIHYESNPRTSCANADFQSKPVTPEKSTNLLKKIFRSISNDQSKRPRSLDDHRTVYKRSHSATLPNSNRIIAISKPKKSHSFRMRRPKIFKKESSKKANRMEDCRQCASLDIQSSLSSVTPSSTPLTEQPPRCGDEQPETCSQLADQTDNDPVCHVDNHNTEAAEKLPTESCPNLSGIVAAQGKDTCNRDEKCISRPVSSSSEESIQSPPTTPDLGFCSSEESKRVFIVYGKDTIEEAKKLYLTFRSHPHYDCRMEAVDSLEMAEDKPLYIMREIMAGDFVFICVSPLLKEIFEAGIKEDGDPSLTFAGSLIRGKIFSSGKNPSGKFMTVVTKGASRDDIPFFLLPYECYIWPLDKKKMENIIEGRPEFVPPPISAKRNEPKPRIVTAPVF